MILDKITSYINIKRNSLVIKRKDYGIDLYLLMREEPKIKIKK